VNSERWERIQSLFHAAVDLPAGELLTGYEILTKQTSPSVRWLERARENLVKLYTQSNQPEKAKRFQTELDRP
jgi:hypothetical protein